MIQGRVNADREAVVELEIEGDQGDRARVDAAIDTGFNGSRLILDAQIGGEVVIEPATS